MARLSRGYRGLDFPSIKQILNHVSQLVRSFARSVLGNANTCNPRVDMSVCYLAVGYLSSAGCSVGEKSPFHSQPGFE